MKLAQIAEKTEKELMQLVSDERKHLSDLVIELRTKKVSNVKEIYSVKKTIARALTVLRQRELTKEEATNE
jgi:large subunit ribosomal protein L29